MIDRSNIAEEIEASGESVRLDQIRTFVANRPPINDSMGFHEYKESEFPEGAGHCDLCGGGPEAQIHKRPVDQMARIADALERIAAVLESWDIQDGGALDVEIREKES